jgi:hypothetical protein
MTSRFSSALQAEELCPPLGELGHIFQQANQPNVVMPSRHGDLPRLAPVANAGPVLQGPYEFFEFPDSAEGDILRWGWSKRGFRDDP